MIAQGNESIEALSTQLSAYESLAVRLLLLRVNDGLRLSTGIAIAPEINTPTAVYDYGDVTFIRGTVPSSALRDWLEGGHGRLADLEFQVGTLQPPQWSTRPSLFPASGGTRPNTPYTEYRLYASDRIDLPHRELLVGPGVPFFPDLASACRTLLYDLPGSLHSSWTVPSEALSIRVLHPEARITSVRLTSTAVHVGVDGTDLNEVELIVSADGRELFRDPATAIGIEDVPIGKSPDDLWIVLARGSHCVDFRELRGRWPNVQGAGDETGVEVGWNDLRDEVELLRLQGEGASIEFKERWPAKDQISKVVAAFANAQGGVILLGVRDRTGEIVGVDDDLAQLRDRIDGAIANRLLPVPSYHIDHCEIENKVVVVIRVLAGNAPYGVGQQHPVYYVRRGATTMAARPEDLRAMMQPVDQLAGWR